MNAGAIIICLSSPSAEHHEMFERARAMLGERYVTIDLRHEVTEKYHPPAPTFFIADEYMHHSRRDMMITRMLSAIQLGHIEIPEVSTMQAEAYMKIPDIKDLLAEEPIQQRDREPWRRGRPLRK